MFKKLVFIAALAALAVGCTKETELVLSSESGTLEYKAGSYSLNVTSSDDWTLTPGGTYDWITPSKTSGKMGDQITFNALINLTGKIRSASYTITSGSQTKNISINLGRADAILNENEQVKTEVYRPTQRLRVYVLEVKNGSKGPRILVSRTHPDLVKRLFEQEVAEIQDGTVEIKSIAREAGSRTKIAVYSKDPNVDAVGACVGVNGSRVNLIVDELGGEKIDVINWDENPGNLIQNALSPAKIVAVFADPDEKSAKVVVPDYQLSLAIGKEGQNARLAARLTGYKIDIKSETQAKDAPGFRMEDYLDDEDDYEEDEFEEAAIEEVDEVEAEDADAETEFEEAEELEEAEDAEIEVEEDTDAEE